MTVNEKLCNICLDICTEAILRTKYPKHMFHEEIKIKQGLSNISFCPLRILYNSKFIIMTASLGTNAVVVTRVHCIWKLPKYIGEITWQIPSVYHIISTIIFIILQ